MTYQITVVVYILLSYVAIVNIVTTYRLIFCDIYEVSQKLLQLLLIWLLPLIGSVIVASVLNTEPVKLSEKASRYSLLLKWLLLPLFIAIESDIDDDSGDINQGYAH